ncbi:MgtC/SapB family protein [Sphingosinicella rhizophila]|uniref:Protein MgtC n=1 Tax=Sphingosinicella rhizophila TaxID=3050082 RepID=A0ABU3Q6R6_9SPHN|nr:MgtC/SapB family protein [Sphingosinicella sp. GR2756]MDT9599101.1 MgtC/SapB family protein [Sphingosinicella sp. GR2756]
MEAGTFSPIHISWLETLLRIAASILLPLMIGIDRFLRRKPIDFRPFVIVSLSACALSLGTLELAARATDPQIDLSPSRIFAGVITGIGFLGAGAMFRQDNYVKGAGSASSIWASGVIGILSGIGLLWLAAILAAGVLLLLMLSAPFTSKYDPE